MNKSRLPHFVINGFVLAVVGCDQSAPVAVSDAKARPEEAAALVREEPSKNDRFLAIAADLRNGEYRVFGNKPEAK